MSLGDDERGLVARCRRGDEAAWAALYCTYAPVVTMFIRGALGPCADVEDVTQRVFLELLRTLGQYREQASLKTWLLRIASNVVRKQKRSWWRFRRKAEAYAAQLGAEDAEAPELASTVDARMRLELVADALDSLSVEFRMTWVMVELQGMTVEDAAHALGVRPATVRTRHHRAKRQILERLMARGSGLATVEGERSETNGLTGTARLVARAEVVP